MIKTSQGDFYSSKEILLLLLKNYNYDLKKDWQLKQTFGGFFISEVTHDAQGEAV